MKKFFLFRREEINEGSSRSSDTGVGLSVLAVPVDHVSFLTASKGAVNVTFNDAGIYENVELFTGDSVEKTNVTISCELGEELGLMENILNFISAQSTNNIMKFDVASGESTFSKSVSGAASDILSKVKVNATTMNDGRLSIGDSTEQTANTIADINFNGNLPILDYNHEGLSGFADEAEITSWSNAGSSGATHDIAANVGTPTNETGSATSGLAKDSANINLSDYFIIPNAFTVKNDYTLYVVLSTEAVFSIGPMFGDSAGETVGFSGKYAEGGSPIKFLAERSVFTMRHDGLSGPVASVDTDNSEGGTASFIYPDQDTSDINYESVQVFVIRRDKNFNIFMQNRDGDIVAFIPAKTRFTNPNLTVNSGDRTDGDLLIEHLGTTAGNVLAGFKGHMARFGVIDYNIGVNAAANLAQDLFTLYKP